MLKAMMFIDGTWLDVALRQRYTLGGKRPYIEDLPFGQVVDGVREHLKQYLGFEIDVVRSHWVAGHPSLDTVAPDETSQGIAKRIADGWASLRKHPATSVELYPYDFKNKSFVNGGGEEGRTVREKCVDVAVATKMLYFAAIPGAYDVAVLVSGDTDYVPVLRAVRALGKRVLVAFVGGDRPRAPLLCDDSKGSGDVWDVPPFDIASCLHQEDLFYSRRR